MLNVDRTDYICDFGNNAIFRTNFKLLRKVNLRRSNLSRSDVSYPSIFDQIFLNFMGDFRKHSHRMCTARKLTVSHVSGVGGEVPTPTPEGTWYQRYPPEKTWDQRYPPISVNRHTCGNITFPQFRFRLQESWIWPLMSFECAGL